MSKKGQVDLHDIKNKIRRSEIFHARKSEALVIKKKEKGKRKKEMEEAEANGVTIVKKIPRTIENTRKYDETFVENDDEEVRQDEKGDEFKEYYNKEKTPKVLITTSDKARETDEFIIQMLGMIPNSHYYSRKGFQLKTICAQAAEKGFTDVVLFHEDKEEINSMLMVHLPDGPTAHFKLSSVVMPKDIAGHGKASTHKPELILNNFDTRLGHRLGRMFGSLFDMQPNFHGRRVVTLHNQRDFIFFRHHRYIFDDTETARLQECGPRFTLKLKSLQNGLPGDDHKEFEFIRKKELGTGKKDFFL